MNLTGPHALEQAYRRWFFEDDQANSKLAACIAACAQNE